MKKTLLFAIAIVSIGFTSCKKDYSCECTENGQVVLTAEMENTRRPEASAACKLAGTNSTMECKLK